LHAGAQAVLAHRASDIPEPLRDREALERAKERAAAKVQLLKQALDTAQQEASKARLTVVACETELKAVLELAEQSQRRVEGLRSAFAGRLQAAGFADDADFQAAKRSPKGRFHLQRTTVRGDRRAAAALDLEVYDTYTGTTRPVNTLSGGESFLASLALALRLADVVQAYAGGIHLETIFVDEGFGSLDPEALDLAFRALVDLERGGRLVGIISHVPELKERIDVRLEVTSTNRGSVARFVVP